MDDDERSRRNDETDDVELPPEDDVERASENVLEGWPRPLLDEPLSAPRSAEPVHGEPDAAPFAEGVGANLGKEPNEDRMPRSAESEPGWAVEPPEAGDAVWASVPETTPDSSELGSPERLETDVPPDDVVLPALSEHAPGELVVPPGIAVLEGEPRGERRAVGVVVSRFNGEITTQLLAGALDELELRGVERHSITVMPVPGAFELPVAAMALAKTRRFACVVALGCVIRGDTPHFDYVASEAASGLQLAAIETGVPVAFGLLTLDDLGQAAPRLTKGAEAVRTALEMADVFANLRAAASR